MKIEVTENDIREGYACDCDSCPVAMAVTRATKDDGRVFSLDYELRLGVGPFSISAPWQVRKFVMAFDDFAGHDNVKPKLPRILPEELSPFSFEIPSFDDSEWEEQCGNCGNLAATNDLDDDGYCEECRDK